MSCFGTSILNNKPFVYVGPPTAQNLCKLIIPYLTYGTAREQVYSTHWSTCIPRKIFCEARRVTRVWYASEQITCAHNYARKLCYTRFLRTNTHSHTSWIARSRKFAREFFHAIATCMHSIIMRVNLQWRPPWAAYSSPIAVATCDCHVYIHVILNNVHYLE